MTDRLAVSDIPSPLEAHSIPLDNPLHGPPPARFRDGEVLVIEYRTDPEAIAALVPEPLGAGRRHRHGPGGAMG